MRSKGRIIRLAIALALGALTIPASPAFAQYAGPRPSPTTPSGEGPTVLGKRLPAEDPLPVTGADVAGFAAIGLAAVGAGIGIRYRVRKHAR